MRRECLNRAFRAGIGNLFGGRADLVNILGFAGPLWSQLQLLCSGSEKAAGDDT